MIRMSGRMSNNWTFVACKAHGTRSEGDGKRRRENVTAAAQQRRLRL
uniref:Uncharacterized protein n=1 Tax=Peronospora matthiolae TaxID=2874970 RepID=A0AAV1UVN0_9STRA